MPTLELIKLIVSSGELGLLAVVLYGLFRLADKYAPQALAAYASQTAAIAGQTAAISALTAKIDGLERAVNDTRSRASEASEDVAELRGAAFATGQHAAITTERPPLPTNPDRRRP